MDIKKWKSVAIKLEDYLLLKAYCDEKYRAEKEKTTKEVYLKKLLKRKK